MNLQRASGRIENLHVVEDKRNVLFGPQMQEAAGLSAVVFAAAGMGGAAVQTSINSDAADDVSLYSFDLGGVKYAGCTRKVTFKEGDEVEIVFEPKPIGNEVLGVRRPSTRSIWLYPYMSRGTFAALKFGMRHWVIWSVALSFLLLLIGPLWSLLRGKPSHIFEMTTMAFAIVAAVGIFLAPRFLRFARAANEVFAAFGCRMARRGRAAGCSHHRSMNGMPLQVSHGGPRTRLVGGLVYNSPTHPFTPQRHCSRPWWCVSP